MKPRLIYLIFFGLSVVYFGCKKFVQIGPPDTKLVTASVFDNNSAATAAQLAIYTSMATRTESYNLERETGMLGDELKTYNLSATTLQYYDNAMLAVNAPGPWNDAYNYIYQANAIISAAQGNVNLNAAVSSQLLGESLFIRAFWFFYLVNLYGDVPLVLNTDYTLNSSKARTPKAQVYQQIIADIKSAKALLNPSYVDASDTTVTTVDRTRPNKSAAGALLARVYLYMGDNVDAEKEADSVINNTLYSLVPNLNNVFKVNSHEAIWQLGIPLPTTVNTPEGEYFILASSPGSSAQCCAISQRLLFSFEQGDQRRVNWVDSFKVTQPSPQTYYYSYKYQVKSGAVVTEDVMVLRLAEQYLIRAEARVNQGNLSGGVADLDIIRNRASLPNISDSNASSGPALLTAILHERKVELFTEWGHRWFDLIRTGSADSVMSVVTPLKGGAWSTDGHQLLFPLSTTELIKDASLVQNPGY